MKKTVISIALLFAVSIPILHYGQTSKTTLSAQKKENLIPISRVFDKLSKASKVPYLYSASDFKNVMVEESAINYSSLESSLNYLKGKYHFEYEIKNNTVILRKTANKSQALNDEAVPLDTLLTKEKKIDEIVIIG